LENFTIKFLRYLFILQIAAAELCCATSLDDEEVCLQQISKKKSSDALNGRDAKLAHNTAKQDSESPL
jgi:hypothetical protein